MKKLLISVLALLLIILAVYIIMYEITISNWSNKNIGYVEDLSKKLDERINTATQLKNQEYPQSIEKLETSIETLKLAKENYEKKINSISASVDLGIVEIKEYKIERLWIALENYAKEEGIELKLDIIATASDDIYDLDITLAGEYMGIMDFIYHVEKDDTLGFKILNFKIEPYVISTQSQSETAEEDAASIGKFVATTADVNKLKATFKIEGVGIEFN